MQKLKIALPKGSLQKATMDLFVRAGWEMYLPERSYTPTTNDAELEIMLVRSQEIPRYVSEGIFDMGITGYDWIRETSARVKEVGELVYAKSSYRSVRWVLAAPENSRIRSAEDLKGKRIATELVNVVKDWLKRKKINAEVEFSWGATEIKAPKLCDAIVELTETGSSLRAHNLRIIDEIMTSTTRLIANPVSWRLSAKRKKIENIYLLLKGALQAQSLVGLKMNVPCKAIKGVVSLVPGLKKPTISTLSDPNWIAMEVVVPKEDVRKLIPRLKEKGASGIIEYPLNKVIY